MIGQLLDGRYKITQSLGAGGFGQTFIAEDSKQFNKCCVVKQLKPSFSNPDALLVARRLFESEAQLLNRLGDHDQIPRLLAYFEADNEFFLVQEFVEGHGLEKEVVVGKKHSEEYAIALLESLLEPLAFIHEQQVIHRDIKPANLIRRQQDGKIVLIDFGAVKELAMTQVNAQGQTQVGTIIGTPGYMASEQGRGKPKCSSDIYAAGMIIIQTLTGKIPPMGYNVKNELYEDPDTAEIIWRQDTDVSPEFAAILDKMIRYDFRQRYRSATEVKAAIATLGTQSKTTATPTGSDVGTVVQGEIPETTINSPKALVNPTKTLPYNFDNYKANANAGPNSLNNSGNYGTNTLSATNPVARHWSRVLFRACQRFIAGSLLLMGVPFSFYGIYEVLNPNVSQENRDGAAAALFVFLPMTGAGSWMLWSLHRRVVKEETDSDWLRESFYQTLESNAGEITVLKFAQTSRLSGPDSQRYLEARVKEFNGEVQTSESGETVYRFKF